MKSYSKLKQKAILLRRKGNSYQTIQRKLKISKSTLHYWLADIPLSLKQKQKLKIDWENALIKARKIASGIHRKNKLIRITKINVEATRFIKQINIDNKILELFLSGLYLGDGFKITGRAGLGSSNPEILLLFITLLRKIYKIDESKFRAAIFARADQNLNSLLNFWSKLLNIPKNQFHKTQIDKRTIKNKSYLNYKGVCAVNYFDISLQRRLLAISAEMIKYINSSLRSRSSVG